MRLWALVAHALLAAALALSFGRNHPPADLFFLGCVPAVAMGLRALRAPRSTPFPLVPAVAWIVALASTLAVLFLDPGVYVDAAAPTWPMRAMSAAASIAVLSFAFDLRFERAPSRVISTLRCVLLLALAAGLGAWMLRVSPAPRIDVWDVHQQGADAFLHGRQVYADGAIHTEDTSTHTRAIDAYAYPPLNLILTAAAYAVTGETRWAQLIAILAGAWLLRAVAARAGQPRPLPDLLMACLLFHPRGLFVLEQAWGEPLALLPLGGFALAVLAGHRAMAAIGLGVLCALKQHYLLFLPALILVPGMGMRGMLIALAVVVAVDAPFAIASPAGFWNAVVMHHVRNPFRADSLSLTAILWKAGIALPSWVGFVAAVASLGSLRWAPRELGALLFSSSLTFLVFYMFGRQAFCNYYYLLGATWLFAAASWTRAPRARQAGAC